MTIIDPVSHNDLHVNSVPVYNVNNESNETEHTNYYSRFEKMIDDLKEQSYVVTFKSVLNTMMQEFLYNLEMYENEITKNPDLEYKINYDIKTKLINILNLIYSVNASINKSNVSQKYNDLPDTYSEENHYLHFSNYRFIKHLLCNESNRAASYDLYCFQCINVHKFIARVIKVLYEIDVPYIIDVILAQALLYSDAKVLDMICYTMTNLKAYQNIVQRFCNDDSSDRWNITMSHRDLIMHRAFEIIRSDYYGFLTNTCHAIEYVHTCDGFERVSLPLIKHRYLMPDSAMMKTILCYRLNYLAKVYHVSELSDKIDRTITDLHGTITYSMLDDLIFRHEIPYNKSITVNNCVFDSLTALGKALIVDAIMPVRILCTSTKNNTNAKKISSKDVLIVCKKYKSWECLEYCVRLCQKDGIRIVPEKLNI